MNPDEEWSEKILELLPPIRWKVIPYGGRAGRSLQACKAQGGGMRRAGGEMRILRLRRRVGTGTNPPVPQATSAVTLILIPPEATAPVLAWG